MNGEGLSEVAIATSFQITSQPSTVDTFKSKTKKPSVNTATVFQFEPNTN